jgi:hypothetical protein
MKENMNLAATGDFSTLLDREALTHLRCGQTQDHRRAWPPSSRSASRGSGGGDAGRQSSFGRTTPATLHEPRRSASPHVAPSPSSSTTFAVVIRTSRPLSFATASSQPGL